jgi:hypothetical protein
MTDLQWFVTYDPIQNAWIGTGKTFTIGEQITRFKEKYADYKNRDEWRVLLNVFLLKKNQEWEELRAKSEEFDALIEKIHLKLLYRHNKKQIHDLLDELAELADAINQPREEQNG